MAARLADEICPDRTDCRCAEAKGMQCVLRPARENRPFPVGRMKMVAIVFGAGAGLSPRVRRAGFGVEIRESRVRLCGDKEMVT